MYYSNLDIKDIEEFPKPDEAAGPYSEFFLDTFSEVFPAICQQELFDFFSFVMHPYRRCFHTPAASPKNEEIESAMRNKGKKGSCTFQRDNGPFIARPVAAFMFDAKHEHDKHYYTSDTRRPMFAFDVDGHKSYQTREMTVAAQQIIEEEFRAVLGTSPSFVSSGRGENGYCLLDLGGEKPEVANQVAHELQDAVRKLLAKHGNLADFEIKGTITSLGADGKLQAGVYGKLPTCSPDWNYKWFDHFRCSRKVTLNDLRNVIDHINNKVTEADLCRHEQLKHEAILAHYLPVPTGQTWRLSHEIGNFWEEFTLTYQGRKWVAKRRLPDALIDKMWPYYQPEPLVPKVGKEIQEDVPGDLAQQVFFDLDKPKEKRIPKKQQRAGFTSSKKLSIPTPCLHDEPDSYKRQLQALLVFARSLGRVPKVDEALDYIEKNGLYTGSWAENNVKRAKRVAGILKKIANTFDRAKCKERTVDSAKLQAFFSVNAGKYDAWANANYPNGIVRLYKKRLGQDGQVYEEFVRVPTSFISLFVAMCEFCLLVDSNDDDSFPQDRAMLAWDALEAKGLVTEKFCPRKWAVCRDAFDKSIVDVFDREYYTGKSMKWRVGRYFPGLGLWKTKREPSLLDPVSLAEFSMRLKEKKEKRLNSLLRQQSVEMAESGYLQPIRPPPTTSGG